MQAPWWKVLAGGLAYSAIVLGPLIVLVPWMLATWTAVAGALCIWRIVRILNERDDPRYAKRPPDPP